MLPTDIRKKKRIVKFIKTFLKLDVSVNPALNDALNACLILLQDYFLALQFCIGVQVEQGW